MSTACPGFIPTLPKKNWASLSRQAFCSFPWLLPAAPQPWGWPGAGSAPAGKWGSQHMGPSFVVWVHGALPASALPTDPGSPINTACGQFFFPVWGLDGLGSFLLYFQRHWDFTGRRKIPATLEFWGVWGISEPRAGQSRFSPPG